LSQIEIPAPPKLKPDDILLQSNRAVRLTDIYNDTVDAATANELLEDDDNLKTLLLTGEISGQRDRVKYWIANQKMEGRDLLHIPRPDVQGAASTYIRELLSLETDTKQLDQKRNLQIKLRIAHKQNWIAFISDTNAEEARASRRAAVVDNALDRVNSNAVESSRGSWSARMLAPISSSGPQNSFAGPSMVPKLPPAPSPLANCRVLSKDPYQPTPSSTVPMIPLPAPVHHHLFSPADPLSDTGDPPSHFLPNTDLLFIPGYKHNRGSNSTSAFGGECPLCGDKNAILALLVKKPAAGLPSPGFPEPNSVAALEFPLVIGAYPEAGILSSFVCCDSCAYHLVKMKKSPYSENLVGAIPLIHEAFSGKFEQTTLNTLDNTLSKRLAKSVLQQVFLSILHNTLMSLKDDCEDIAEKALHWAASFLLASISIPSTLRTNFNTRQLSTAGNIPLRQALSNSLDALSKPSPSLLQYPLEGFVIIIQCMIDLNLDPTTVLLKNAVFHRILYHITEKYHESLTNNGREATVKRFHNLTWSPESQSDAVQTPRRPIWEDTFDIISAPHLSISISSLIDKHLLSIEDGELLQKLGELFVYVKDKCSSSIAVYLHILCREQASVYSNPMETFDRIRALEAFRLIVEAPHSIGEAVVKELIGSMCF